MSTLNLKANSYRKLDTPVVSDFLKSGDRQKLNELVGRSAFYYDKQIRDASGIRYLPLHAQAVSNFASGLAENFRPDLKTYAACCQTTNQAANLGYVCSHVRRCTRSHLPSFMSRDFVRDESAYIKAASDAALQSWDRTSRAVIQSALSDVYLTLCDRSPELLGPFVDSLDGHTRTELQRGVMARRDISVKSLDEFKSFLEQHPGKPVDVLERDVLDTAQHGFYNWSFSRSSVYDRCREFKDDCHKRGRASEYFGGLRSDIITEGSRRCERHDKFNSRVFDRIKLREHFVEHNGELLPGVQDRLSDYYGYLASQYMKSGISDSVKFKVRGPVIDKDVFDIEDVFRACPDNQTQLSPCIKTVSDTCSRLYDELQSFSSNAGSFTDEYGHVIDTSTYQGAVRDRLESHLLSQTLMVYDNFSKDSQEAADAFINNLSEDLCQAVCRCDATIGGHIFKHTEVMDEDGLSANCVLDDTRTQRALDKHSSLELLQRCLYRYELKSHIDGNELKAYLTDGFSGKVPNETFLHIAANCNTPEDARTLSRIVNLSVQACVENSSTSLDESVQSLIRDDVRCLLDSDAFRTDILRDEFARGLSHDSVDALSLLDFVDKRLPLAKDPVEGPDYDVLFAKDQGMFSGKWFSEKSADTIVKKASESAKKQVRSAFFEKEASFFESVNNDVGLVATACCADYASFISGDIDSKAERFNLPRIFSECHNADDLRLAAQVCNLAIDESLDGSDSLLFKDLSESDIKRLQTVMKDDMKACYDKLKDFQKPKFMSVLTGPAWDVFLESVGGAWSNGVFLNNVDPSKAPAAGYANRLNMFNAPDFSKSPVFDKQMIFAQYQDNPDRGTEIRDLIRAASAGIQGVADSENSIDVRETVLTAGSGMDSVNSGDAHYKLAMSCLSTYQSYGAMADAESRGETCPASKQRFGYSLYELAEQCNPKGRSDSENNIKVLAAAYGIALDYADKQTGAYADGMRFAIKADMARSLKFLDTAGMKSSFFEMQEFLGLREGRHYEFLKSAESDMPVYINSDAQKFMGRSRPKGVCDIKDVMSTDDLIAKNSERIIKFSLGRDTSDLDRELGNLVESSECSNSYDELN